MKNYDAWASVPLAGIMIGMGIYWPVSHLNVPGDYPACLSWMAAALVGALLSPHRAKTPAKASEPPEASPAPSGFKIEVDPFPSLGVTVRQSLETGEVWVEDAPKPEARETAIFQDMHVDDQGRTWTDDRVYSAPAGYGLKAMATGITELETRVENNTVCHSGLLMTTIDAPEPGRNAQ